MPAAFEELDYQQTELGELVLRRRNPVGEPDVVIYEVKLAGRFLMSSHVTFSERELARRALGQLDGTQLDVLVGGLGLGYTAAAALADDRVQRLDVVERLQAVIDWHRHRLVPLGEQLTTDPRCHLLLGDCFARLTAPAKATYDAILIDIDDSPIHLLDEGHESFYETSGLRSASAHLKPGGLFALWTSLPMHEDITARLDTAFAQAWAEECRFENPLLEAPETNAIYYARP
jgi:spermidine synthase